MPTRRTAYVTLSEPADAPPDARVTVDLHVLWPEGQYADVGPILTEALAQLGQQLRDRADRAT